MFLNKSYNRVHACKRLSDTFPIKKGLKQGDAPLPLFFKFASGCVIRGIQVNQDGLKLNCALRLLVYANYVNVLGGRVLTIKKNTEALVVAS